MTGNADTSESAAAGEAPPAAHDVCKQRASSVVMAYREVDWEAVERGDREAVAGLVSACDQHEQTRQFLESQVNDENGHEVAADVAARLEAGLEKFYAERVAPRLRSKNVLQQMLAVAEPPSMAADGTGEPGEEGLLPRSRPTVTVGHTMRMNTGCGNLYITVNEDDSGQPFELFNHMGKAGGCAASQNEAIGRLISYALRCGAKIEPLIKQLKGISCHRPAWSADGKISSCADAISKALEKYYESRQAVDALPFPEPAGNGSATASAKAASANGATESASVMNADDLVLERQKLNATLPAGGGGGAAPASSTNDDMTMQGACPECGSSHLAFEEGCVKCYSCAFTECG